MSCDHGSFNYCLALARLCKTLQLGLRVGLVSISMENDIQVHILSMGVVAPCSNYDYRAVPKSYPGILSMGVLAYIANILLFRSLLLGVLALTWVRRSRGVCNI